MRDGNVNPESRIPNPEFQRACRCTTMRSMRRLLRVAALLAIAFAAQAQAPSASWRTITTEHFRVHFPAPSEAWATRAASRLESIRSGVVKEVGFDWPRVIDVIVANPVAQANGLAYPLLDSPRIVLYTEPPGPDEEIGAYSDWIDLLVTHEVTHIMHMLRPSRSPVQRALERFVLPLDPITLSAPRWVLEGYATVIEGRLTGAGRPSSSMRAVVLRQWAAAGRMPSYSQLDSDTRFLGMSMAYLAGSAYLEWLERRTGAGSLRRLWARMTARQRRSFSSAFSGTFGDSPERLYGRFVAELTASALAVNRATELHEGRTWQATSRGSGDPSVSPDGSHLAIVIRSRNEPSQIVVWSTAPATDEREKFDKRIAAMIERDPEDFPPVVTKPLPRKVEHSFRPVDGGDVETPRWTSDGAILFSHRQPGRDGFLHRDLFLWNPAAGESRRVTRLADVFDADPFPGGRTAVAVRSRYGWSQLAEVDLATGEVHALNEPSLDAAYSHPRVSRDGKRIAYVEHRHGRWSLFVMERGGEPRAIAADVASPEWSGDDLVATVLEGGFAELHRITFDGAHHPLTRSEGGAFQPAPSPDGRVFFMALDPDGFVVRVVDGSATAPSPPPYDAALVPALPLENPAPSPFATETVSAPHPYGMGRQEGNWFIGETAAPRQNATELGLRVGDVIGRLDTLFIASLGRNHGQRGAAIATAYRGWPVEVSAHLFNADDRLVKRSGLELRGSWSAQTSLLSFRADAGVLAGKPLDLGFAGAGMLVRQVLAAWRAEEEVHLSGEAGSLRHYRGVGRASLRRGRFSIGGRYEHDEMRGGEVIDVGGAMSSILPLSAIPNRVFDPALPIGTLAGRMYDGARVETNLPVFPATIFYQRHRTERGSVSLAGLQFTFGSAAMPILRYPGLDVTAGVARILDEPLRNRTKWWLVMRWRP